MDNDKKTYQVKLDLGLSETQAEYIVDKLIMPFLFPNQYASQNQTSGYEIKPNFYNSCCAICSGTHTRAQDCINLSLY